MDLVNINLKPQGKQVCRMNSWVCWKFRGFSLFSASKIFAENMQKPEEKGEDDGASRKWKVKGQSSTFPKQLHSTLRSGSFPTLSWAGFLEIPGISTAPPSPNLPKGFRNKARQSWMELQDRGKESSSLKAPRRKQLPGKMSCRGVEVAYQN